MRKSVIISLLSLLLAVGILLGMNLGLSDLKEKKMQAELDAKLLEILPGSTAFEQEAYTGDDANIRTVYKAERGYVVLTATQGYAGTITMLIGVSNDGKVTGLQIRQMSETYGLGWKALTDVDFLAQFLNTKGDAQVGENVDAIAGATVTSKAVARSVNSAVAFVTGADIGSGATSWGG